MYTVTNITDFEVTIRDRDRNISHVHQQGDGKWKCQRCDRYRCEHVKFVKQSGVQLLPKPEPHPLDCDCQVCKDIIASIMTY